VREYDLIADWYAAERVDQTGVPETVALAQSLPPGARVADIGCGNGVPLTKALLDAGVHVVGVDSSPRMLARFSRNHPTTPAVRAVIQALPFADASFEGAVAWGVMFHLPPDEAIAAIAGVSRLLKRGGSFLFTAGDLEGGSDAHVDTMNGVEFRYYSFSIEGYRSILADHGLALLDFHKDKGENGYYLASKRSRG
jgi:SAM-dependent methyltransferase